MFGRASLYGNGLFLATQSGENTTQTLSAGLLWEKRKHSMSVQLDGRQVFDPAQPLQLTTNYRLSF